LWIEYRNFCRWTALWASGGKTFSQIPRPAINLHANLTDIDSDTVRMFRRAAR
jgi:hypothetical protein